MKLGLVIMDLNGGDAAMHFVDEALWNQIQNLPEAVGDRACYEYKEAVGWLITPEAERMPGAEYDHRYPERQGSVFYTVYTQSPVTEELEPPLKDTPFTLLGILPI